jgi:hypothetical protein
MKKIFTLSLLLLSLHFLSEAQGTVKASLRRGSAANRVKIYIKSDATATTNISTLEFNIAVPDSVTIATPIVTSSASSITWQVSPVITEGGYHNFAIVTGTSPITTFNLTSGVEFEVMELEFSDYTTRLPNFVSLLTLPDGGSNGLLLFYSTGSPVSDGSHLYYVSDPPTYNYTTTLVNGYSYPSSGTGGTDISYARLMAGPTPVKLSSFNVTTKNNSALLSWTVENQDATSSYFGIERSTNGTDFTEVGKDDATSQSQASYSYSDNATNASGTVYYRLKMVDKDGQFAYSDVKSVQFTNAGFAVTLYPNPVKSFTKLNITLDQAQVIKVSVNDALGNLVKQIQINGQKGMNEKTLDLSIVPTGSYMIRIQAGQNIKTMPIIKN